jgi:hypothetical protein
MDDELTEHLKNGLRIRVLGGFEEYEEIVASVPVAVVDELGRHDVQLESTLAEYVRTFIDETLDAQSRWQGASVNDNIDLAFADLDAHGVIALQNAGYTIASGWECVEEERAHRPGAKGATFYHGQDLERGVEGGGLYLAFGVLSGWAARGVDAVTIGGLVCATLAKRGVATEWDGTSAKRIRIPPFEWRRRFMPR